MILDSSAVSLSRDPGGPGAVHGSLYASLRTNLPRNLMGFSDFPMADRIFAGDARVFPGHREVLAFLDAFAEESGVAARIRLRSEVLRVAPALGHVERWAVAWHGEDGKVVDEVFDAVVVCNGHWTVPMVPKIRGAISLFPSFLSHPRQWNLNGKKKQSCNASVTEIDNWSGKQIHSHNYHTPEPFRDQVFLLCLFDS